MSSDPDRIARLYEIAAFERPLTETERIEVGLPAQLDEDHVVHLWERAAFERPLLEGELREIELYLSHAA
jgi:hypothetical protein